MRCWMPLRVLTQTTSENTILAVGRLAAESNRLCQRPSKYGRCISDKDNGRTHTAAMLYATAASIAVMAEVPWGPPRLPPLSEKSVWTLILPRSCRSHHPSLQKYKYIPRADNN